MNTLSDYKNRYRKAKTAKTKTKIMSMAMNNLSHENRQKFYSWQVDYMKTN